MAKNNRNNSDFRSLLAPYISKWYYFLISILIFGIFGFVYAKSRQREYRVKASILITQRGSNGMNAMANLGSLFDVGSDVDDEIFLVVSHSSYRNVIEKNGLNITHIVNRGFMKNVFVYKDFPVQVYPAPGIVDTLRSSLKFTVKVSADGLVDLKATDSKSTIADVEKGKFPLALDTKYGKFVVDTTEYYVPGEKLKTDIAVKGYHAAAEELDKNIKSSISNMRAHVINLSMRTPNPKYGEDVLNEIVAEYNRRGIEQSNLQNEKTAAFIEDRIMLIAGDLSDSEKVIQQRKEQAGMGNVLLESQFNYTRKGESYSRLVEAETEAEILKMALAFVDDPANAYELIPSSVSDSQGLATAISTYNNLILNRISMMTNAKEGNASLKILNDRIDAMRSGIRSSIAKALATTEVSINELKTQYNLAQRDLHTLPEYEREMTDLHRQRAVKQELYIHLLKRREETAMLIANAIPRAQVIDEAYTLTDPVSTSKKVIFLAFLLIGGAIPLTVIYFGQRLRNKFDTREEVENLTDVPVLGEICKDNSGEKLVVTSNSGSSVAELFRLMRANLQFVLNNENDKVVLITSTTSGEGKSFISTNLAASLALIGKRVVLVGLDIRKPQLASYLGLKDGKGVTNYLSSGDITVSDITMREPLMENLDVITAGPIPPNPAELLASSKLDTLFEQLRQEYDYIIVDTAPVGMVSDTFTLNRISDATIYVTRVNFTRISDIDFVSSLSRDKRLRKISIVVNGTTSRKGYGYGYESSKK